MKAKRTTKPKSGAKSKKEETYEKLCANSREKLKAMEEARAKSIEDTTNVELKKKADRAVEAWCKANDKSNVARETLAEEEKLDEPIDIYINSKCIKTYQQNPCIMDIELNVYDLNDMVDDEPGWSYEFLCELEVADELLTKMNNSRNKKDRINVFIGRTKL